MLRLLEVFTMKSSPSLPFPCPQPPASAQQPAPKDERSDAARNQFVLAAYPILLAFLARLVRDPATAEDLAQATFEAALRHPDFDPGRPDAVGFLRTKGLWLAQAHQRRRARAPGVLPDAVPDPRQAQPDQALE